MILSIEELRQRDFQISGVNVLHQTRNRGLAVKSRKINGFLYIIHGNCRYSYPGGSFDLSPGSVVYLPIGSGHQLTLMDECLEYIRLDFTITVAGEPVLFSNGPMKMTATASCRFAEAAHRMESSYRFLHDSIGKTELLCAMLQELGSAAADPGKERLAPAVRYILEHLAAEMDCGRLAVVCNLSSSLFYSLFHQQYGMTPLQFRNELLMQKARSLLADGSLTVAETADALGFASAAYFSRFFKKYQGMPPSAFQRASG